VMNKPVRYMFFDGISLVFFEETFINIKKVYYLY